MAQAAAACTRSQLRAAHRPVGPLCCSAGLACGHKFCRQCALESAGFGRAVGAFHNIASHVPNRAACPQCRQRGVFRHAVALREVGRLIQSRCVAGGQAGGQTARWAALCTHGDGAQTTPQLSTAATRTVCRYPSEWAERRAEDKQRLRRLNAETNRRQNQMLHSRNAFDLLFGSL